MNKSQKATLFVFLLLLGALIAGLVVNLLYTSRTETAVPLLIACVLAAFGLVLATARLHGHLRRTRLLAETHNAPQSRLLNVLSQRQWFVLLVGLTVVALGSGAGAGVRIMTAGSVQPSGNAASALAPANPTTAPPTVTVTAPPSPSVSPSPSQSPDPLVSSDRTGSPDPSGSPSDLPAPGATKYLDSERELAGNADARAVTFSAVRFLRGIFFYCSTATTTYIQWNVAGYTRFEATGGIDDNTQGAYGVVVEFLFYDQDGRQLVPKPVEVSVGHYQKITLSLTGVVSLRMTCSGRDSKTNQQRNSYAAFGDPIVVS
jgi:hypothetical protein